MQERVQLAVENITKRLNGQGQSVSIGRKRHEAARELQGNVGQDGDGTVLSDEGRGRESKRKVDTLQEVEPGRETWPRSVGNSELPTGQTAVSRECRGQAESGTES